MLLDDDFECSSGLLPPFFSISSTHVFSPIPSFLLFPSSKSPGNVFVSPGTLAKLSQSSGFRVTYCFFHLAHGSFDAYEDGPRNDAVPDIQLLQAGDSTNGLNVRVREPVTHVQVQALFLAAKGCIFQRS